MKLPPSGPVDTDGYNYIIGRTADGRFDVLEMFADKTEAVERLATLSAGGDGYVLLERKPTS